MTAYDEALRQFRLGYFLRAVADCHGNISHAARVTRVHRNTVQRVLHLEGYSSERVKRLARLHAMKKPPASVGAGGSVTNASERRFA